MYCASVSGGRATSGVSMGCATSGSSEQSGTLMGGGGAWGSAPAHTKRVGWPEGGGSVGTDQFEAQNRLLRAEKQAGLYPLLWG